MLILTSYIIMSYREQSVCHGWNTQLAGGIVQGTSIGLLTRKGNLLATNENGKKWQVVAQRFRLVVCLFGRSTTQSLSGRPTSTSDARVFGLVSHRLLSSRTRLNQRPAQIQQHRHVYITPSSATTTIRPSVQPLLVFTSVCTPPQSPRFSLLARIYTFVRPLCLR